MPPNRPELIGHRGASRERAENSIAAFVRAETLGADAVELDVHTTADGHLVVHHDPRIATGAGAAAIQSLTLAEVGALRIRGEPIPQLSDVIAAVGGRLRIYCELKGPGTVAPALALLKPMGSAAAVHAFDHRMIAEAARLEPLVARGVLETSYHTEPTWPLRAVGARDLWQHDALVDAMLVDAVHRAGGRVIAWTVNDGDRAQFLADIGVDGICTDDLSGVGAALASLR